MTRGKTLSPVEQQMSKSTTNRGQTPGQTPLSGATGPSENQQTATRGDLRTQSFQRKLILTILDLALLALIILFLRFLEYGSF